MYGSRRVCSQGAIEQAMMGQTRGLKSLGIALNENEIKLEIHAQKMEGMTFASEEAAKASATLALIQRRSGAELAALGDKGDRYSEQLKVFGDQIGEISETIGQTLLPALTGIMEHINGVTKWLNGLDDTTKKVIVVIGTLGGGVVTATIAFAAMKPVFSILGGQLANLTKGWIAEKIAIDANTKSLAANAVARGGAGTAAKGGLVSQAVTWGTSYTGVGAGAGAAGVATVAAAAAAALYGVASAVDSIRAVTTGADASSWNKAGQWGNSWGNSIGEWWGSDPEIERRSKAIQEKMRGLDKAKEKQIEEEHSKRAELHKKLMDSFEENTKNITKLFKNAEEQERSKERDKWAESASFEELTKAKDTNSEKISKAKEVLVFIKDEENRIEERTKQYNATLEAIEKKEFKGRRDEGVHAKNQLAILAQEKNTLRRRDCTSA